MKTSNILKVDESLGLVFGYAIVCKENGQDHYDRQGDHIPESVMLKASASFAEGARVAKEMHRGEQAGQVVFMFPMTTDIAKSLGIRADRTGLLVAMKPSDPEILRKFASGEYTGFSIGGSADNEAVA